MPIGLGLASSHVPNMFIPPDEWETRYRQAIDDVPQPLSAAKETPEVRRAYAKRIEAGFGVLRERLAAYKPDALVMISDDHDETFKMETCMPTVALFTGETAFGNLALKFGAKSDDSPNIEVRAHQELSKYLAKELVRRDFDLAIKSEKRLTATGVEARGMGHGFTRTAPKLMPDLDIPVILIWLNCYYEPLPSARRCLDLGRNIAEIFADRPERIAIFGSGGLSHDPRGPRAGWIDEKLDRFVLNAFAEGDPYRLTPLFEFDSDTFHGGTGEIRAWLTAGGAMGNTKAEIVDYMPIHSAIGGIGFASWSAV